mmetsp:Transcript_19700/g.33808  ORF Transcript_19700/g.33808 Transcript_19700/m.33808 type:complete len:380 (+) Transcript_19700:195-1334(+)|eukprot:CAMPEP_0196665292 /NCGR_PEP_ID=MMETSP1086-20130531/60332_1 /TAXON_ID=77921 /ORGANISM="Cyanoptyche  gloeocystis , Strain SAG4.97" /LENGTH=379 /DNA_ID=CAMNT_0042001951 /DNA_START=182 /DNA_END=1321 /DNA_ORIENTATION=+
MSPPAEVPYPNLFKPIKVGSLELKTRIAMSPMTRTRSTDDGVPTDLNVLYYDQRASDGALLITEGIAPDAHAVGYFRQPGLFTDEQIAGWKKVTDAVHAKGGYIFAQLMHCGRVSHSSLIPEGSKIMAPSAIACSGMVHGKTGKFPYEVPEAMQTHDIKKAIEWFKDASTTAIKAGFDGIELHGGNGYLIQEFIAKKSNQRTDEYGGSVENRARFVLETIAACVEAIGADRVAIKFTPGFTFSDLVEDDSEITEIYPYILKEITKYKLIYVTACNFMRQLPPGAPGPQTDIYSLFRKNYPNTLMFNCDWEFEDGDKFIANGDCELFSVGRYYLSNPDLINRLKHGYPLADKNVPGSLWYGPHDPAKFPKGYTDFPAYTP